MRANQATRRSGNMATQACEFVAPTAACTPIAVAPTTSPSAVFAPTKTGRRAGLSEKRRRTTNAAEYPATRIPANAATPNTLGIIPPMSRTAAGSLDTANEQVAPESFWVLKDLSRELIVGRFVERDRRQRWLIERDDLCTGIRQENRGMRRNHELSCAGPSQGSHLQQQRELTLRRECRLRFVQQEDPALEPVQNDREERFAVRSTV